LREKKNVRYKNSREKPLNQEIKPFPSENQTGYKKEDVKDRIDKASQMYQNIEGIKEKVTYEEKGVKETVEINFNKVDFDKLATLPGMYTDKNTRKSKKVSMKASKELLTSKGFKEITDGKFEKLK